MSRKRVRHVVLPVVSGLLFFSACGSGESTAESCLRFEALRVELEAFETNPPSDPEERFEMAETIAGGFDTIRDNARNPELAEAADALSEFYWTALRIYYDNLLLGPDQLIVEVVDQVGIERMKSANLTYERVCGELSNRR